MHAVVLNQREGGHFDAIAAKSLSSQYDCLARMTRLAQFVPTAGLEPLSGAVAAVRDRHHDNRILALNFGAEA